MIWCVGQLVYIKLLIVWDHEQYEPLQKVYYFMYVLKKNAML